MSERPSRRDEWRLGHLTDPRTNLGAWRAECDQCTWVSPWWVDRLDAVDALDRHLAGAHP